MEPFDWQRMFIGDTTILFLLEIVFRTSVMYLYAVGLIRLTSSRGVRQLSAFDIAIIIALGSAVGDPMFYPDVPLLHGIIVITVIGLIQRLISMAVLRFNKVEDFFAGIPLTIIQDGHLELDCIKEAKLSLEDVFMRLRHEGIEHLGQVKQAYVEHDGSFSIYKYNPENVEPGLSIVPPGNTKERARHSIGEIPLPGGYYSCHLCGHTIRRNPEEELPSCSYCSGEKWVKASK